MKVALSRRQILIIGGILVVVLAVLWWRFSPAEVVTVVADDGSAALEFTSGALPRGVNPSEMTITRLSDSGDVVTYELGPDGAVFSEPVTFVLSVPFGGEGTLPVLLTTENGEEVIVDDVTYETDEDGETLTMRAPLTHFSRYLTVEFFFRIREIRDSGTHAIGDVFPVHVAVFTQRNRRFTGEGQRTSVYELMGGPEVNARWGVSNYVAELANPANVERDHSFDRSDFTLTENFVCTHAGNELIRTRTRFSYRYRWYFADEGPGRTFTRPNSFNLVTFSRVRCLGPTTPEPTSEPTVEPTEAGSSGENVERPVLGRLKRIWVRIGEVFVPADDLVIRNAEGPEPEHECRNARGALTMHYHAREGGTVIGTRDLTDPEFVMLTDPGPCGFGFYDDLERINAEGPVY